MSERDGTDIDRSRETESTRAADASEPHEPSMRARRWVIAHRYRDPTEYGIPDLPAWDVRTTEPSGIAFAETDDAEPFIRADQPVRVRR